MNKTTFQLLQKTDPKKNQVSNYLRKGFFLRVFNICNSNLTKLLMFFFIVIIGCNNSEDYNKNTIGIIREEKKTIKFFEELFGRLSIKEKSKVYTPIRIFLNIGVKSTISVESTEGLNYIYVKIPTRNENDNNFLMYLAKLNGELKSSLFKFDIFYLDVTDIKFECNTHDDMQNYILNDLDTIINTKPPRKDYTIKFEEGFYGKPAVLNICYPISNVTKEIFLNFKERISKIKYITVDVCILLHLLENKIGLKSKL